MYVYIYTYFESYFWVVDKRWEMDYNGKKVVDTYIYIYISIYLHTTLHNISTLPRVTHIIVKKEFHTAKLFV